MTSPNVKIYTDNDVIVNPSADRGEEGVDFILSELNKVYDKIEGIDPEYVSLRRAAPLPLDKIQNILLQKGNNSDDAILVEYFITNDKIVIFVISQHEFHIKTVQYQSRNFLVTLGIIGEK